MICRSALCFAATASCALYVANALAVGQRVNAARFVSAWGRYVTMAGLLTVAALEAGK